MDNISNYELFFKEFILEKFKMLEIFSSPPVTLSVQFLQKNNLDEDGIENTRQNTNTNTTFHTHTQHYNHVLINSTTMNERMN